jgi:hypothetical protein
MTVLGFVELALRRPGPVLGLGKPVLRLAKPVLRVAQLVLSLLLAGPG